MVWQKCSGIRRSYLCKFIHKMNCIQKNIEKIIFFLIDIICYTFFLRGDCDEQT